jgi:hypothetical protein
VPQQHRTKDKLESVADALRNTPGVKSVDVNQRTGSILVHHHEHPSILQTFEKTLEESSGELFEALVEGGSLQFAGLTFVGHFIHNFVSSANDQVQQATNNTVSLRTIAPAAMLALGVMRLKRGRGEDLLMSVSPIVLFFYAFDLYWRFNVAEKPEPLQTTARVEDCQPAQAT